MIKNHIVKIQKRQEDSHKGDFGHVLVVAGSKGFTGAAYLTSQAAILSGSGLVTAAIPESLNQIMAVKLTEAMTLCLPETKSASLSMKAGKTIVKFAERADVLAVGPGLSRNIETEKLVRGILAKIAKPAVIDADGISAICGHESIIKKRRSATVLTPHPGEMSRLIDRGIDYVQKNREKIAKSFALKYNCVLVLKGHRTVVASPQGEIYINETGNSGMSTAGSGDVLTGMTASLIGQGIDAYSASVLSVYLHGRAGDIAAKEKGQFSLIASDILSNISKAFLEAV